MPVSQQGALNTTALYVPDVYVQIVPPSENFLNGVPTNILGIVGTAQWGPVNAPVTVGSLADYIHRFGNILPRSYDMGTAVWAAVLNGANNFRCVRVTDGTDTAACAVISATVTEPPEKQPDESPPKKKPKKPAPPEDDTPIGDHPPGDGPTDGNPGYPPRVLDDPTLCLRLQSKYTGGLGNSTQFTLAPGSKKGTWRATVSMPGLMPEVFDNLAERETGKGVWVKIAQAIHQGISGVRGPSELIKATAGTGGDAPKATTLTFAGGTDGADAINGALLLGQDTASRTGLYALRGTGTSIAMLTDCSDSKTWSAQVAFGLSEGVYMIATGPAGESIDEAIQRKENAGIDSTAMKLLFGDWVYFNDTANGTVRLISPQGFVAGRLSGLSPEQSSLNKPLYGIVGTQQSMQHLTYSQAELQQLAQAGIDLITNPIPAGHSFGVRIGQNTGSNAVINGDNYPRLTNYIAYTLACGMGLYIGKLHSPKTRHDAFGTVNAFLSNLWQQGMIGDAADPRAQPFSIRLDNKNNPPKRVARGYMQIDCRITYLSIITKLLINVEGGQSVKVSVADITPQ